MIVASLLACAPQIDVGPVPADQAAAPVRLLAPEAQPGPNVYLAALVAAGSAHDPVGREGLAHLVARGLIDAGAGQRTSPQVREALYPTGAELQVVVEREWVSLRLACHRDHGALCVELFTEALTQPRLDDGDWMRLRDDALHSVRDGLQGAPEALGLEALEVALHEGHPYGHPVAGRIGVLPTLRPEEGRAFHARHYVREAVVAGIAGAWTPQLREALEQGLAALPGRPAPDLPLMAPPAPDQRTLIAIDTDDATTGFHLGHPIDVDRAHPDYAALYLGTLALGAHRQSFGRLFRALRGERGLNYGDYAYIEPWIERGWGPAPEQALLRRHNRFVVWLRPTTLDDGPFALKLALDEVEDWASEGLHPGEFEAVRGWAARTLPLLAPDPGTRLLYALEAEASQTPDLLQTLPEALQALTLEQVNETISRHIHPDRLQIVAVSGEAEALLQRLVGQDPAPAAHAGATPTAGRATRDAAIAARVLELDQSWLLDAEGIFR